MDKKFADEMIGKFQNKFWGFALSKTQNMDEAEELAARIVCEAYTTLRNVDDVYNWEGYLYRIASNVYVHYVKERMGNRTDDINDMELAGTADIAGDVVRQEELALLRREVAWLGKKHREIVLLHYYHNKKISEISKILDIPAGTVKWHLSDAKKQIREGMNKMRKSENLGLEPVKFKSMGHDGNPGSNGDTAYYLSSTLRQNIAYAAYYSPKTVEEISSELGVSPVYVEDEVEFLEENGFLDLLPGGRYRTNIYISDLPQDYFDKIMELDKEIAKEVCRLYVPLLAQKYKDYKQQNIFVPEDDFNYLLWNLVGASLGEICERNMNFEALAGKNYRVKRKDGGEYIAHATVAGKEPENEDNRHYIVCGDMTRASSVANASSWSLSSDFDTRVFGWEDNFDNDCGFLHFFMEGKLEKTDALLVAYERIYSRGLVVNEDGQDKVNVIVVREPLGADGKVTWWNSAFKAGFPDVPKELDDFIREKCRQRIKLAKQYYPEHMHGLVEHYNQFIIDRVMVLDELLAQGILKPLSERQKKGVMTIVMSDILPEEK